MTHFTIHHILSLTGWEYIDWEYTCTADPGRARRGGAAPCRAGKEKETAATKSEYALGHAQRKSIESRILKEVLESIQSECLRLRLIQIGDRTSNSDQTFKSERCDVS